MTRLLKTLFIIIITTVSSLQFFASTGEVPSVEYRKRLLGNNAFDSGLYDVAMNYYKNYLEDAAGNSPAIRDAYFCLITTCLRSNNLEKAQTLYDELKNKHQSFFKSNHKEQIILEYWHAEILLKKGQIEKSETIFKNILKSSSEVDKNLTINVLTGLGTAEIRQEKFKDAEQTFLRLKKYGAGTNAEKIAIKQLILINIVQGNLKKAEQILKKSTKSTESLSIKLRPLMIFALIKEKKLGEAGQEYNKAKHSITAPNAMWYTLASALAKSYIEINNYVKAIPLLEDASILAPSLYYKEKTTLALINTLLAAKQNEKVINTATFFLDNLPNTTAKDGILLRVIEILIKDSKYSEAANFSSKYLTLSVPSNNYKIKIASETGQALLKISKYSEAMKYFEYTAKYGTNTEEKDEGRYWNSETFLLENKDQQALKLFKELKNSSSLWKEKAAYKIATIYIRTKNFKKAVETLKLFIAEYPKSKIQPSPVFLYATALKKIDKTKEAISYFAKYAKDNPKDSNAAIAYFEAGYLSLGIGKYSQGIEYFEKILKEYKKTNKTPNVLYHLLYANYLAGNNEASVKYAKILINEYPKSEFAIQTLYWITNYYSSNKDFNKALESLTKIQNKFSKKPTIVSRALYDRAYILNIDGKPTEALEILNDLENDYSTMPILPKSLFLKGDILSSNGKYLDAISYYLKATQTNQDPTLDNAAWGRVGDCYFAQINYAKNKKQKSDFLLKAVDYYQKIIAEKSLSPLFKIQTLYKLGKCYELIDEKEKALTMYHEAVYGTVLDAEQGETPSTEWFAKSGIALARMLQDKETASAAEAAISVYKTLIQYKIQPIQDFLQRIKELSNNYKLKE